MDTFYFNPGEIGKYKAILCRILKKLKNDYKAQEEDCVPLEERIAPEGEWWLIEIDPPIPGTVYGLQEDLKQLILKPYFSIYPVSAWQTPTMTVFLFRLNNKRIFIGDKFDSRQLIFVDKGELSKEKGVQ